MIQGAGETIGGHLKAFILLGGLTFILHFMVEGAFYLAALWVGINTPLMLTLKLFMAIGTSVLMVVLPFIGVATVVVGLGLLFRAILLL